MDFTNFWFPKKQGGGGDPGDFIGQSLRFRGESRLVSVNDRPAGNFTISFWVKWGNKVTNSSMTMMSFTGNQCYQWRVPDTSQAGEFVSRRGGSIPRLSNGTLRDQSAWYHIVLQNDNETTTMYLNGVRQQSAETPNGGMSMTIGSNLNSSQDDRFCGHLSNYFLIDGQLVEPTAFGRFNEFDVWVPVEPSNLTFGPKGFFLDFSDPNDIGKDVSGNGNDMDAIGFDTAYVSSWQDTSMYSMPPRQI